jgi:hypothetical protein
MSAFFEGLSSLDHRRRLWFALAVAIAVHCIAAGFIPRGHPRMRETETIVAQQITIAARPKPTPRPAPTAHVTPRPRASIAAKVAVRAPAPKAAAPRTATHGGRAAQRIVRATPVPHVPPAAKAAVAKGPGAGVANGGTGTGAGAGNGTGGDAGTASGTEGEGNGNGGEADTTPCGYVELTGHHTYGWNNGAHYRDVSIVIHLRNGETVGDVLHWPFAYANDDEDPWSTKNLKKPDLTALLQLPPPGYDLAGRQKPATVFAVEQTGPDGRTRLRECPEPKLPN